MTKLQRLLLARDSACVTRFHTARVVHDETVAEHSFNVVNMLLIMTGGHASKELLVAALVHDMGEPQVGDIPSPVKRALPPEVGAAMEDLEQEAILCIHPYIYDDGLRPEEHMALSLADKLDGLMKCRDELRLGNKGIREIGDRYIQYIQELTDKWDTYRVFAEQCIFAYRQEL